MSTDEMTFASAASQKADVLPPHSKRCPRCGEILFDDMDVCFGCLYDFTREPYRLPDGMIGAEMLPQAVEVEEPDGLSEPNEPPVPVVPESQTVLHQEQPPAFYGTDRKLMLITPQLQVGLPLPARGITVGYAPDNDVVLHAEGIAEYHLVLVPRTDDVVAVGLVEDAFESMDAPIDRDCAFMHEEMSIFMGGLTLGVSRL